jgi:GrpB-like predicted nucleotidyltransferase (UPF0157 family)
VPIQIVEYRSSWPAAFAGIAADLRSVLGASARRIDHIGSTAVPGLAAKDKIDIQVSVSSRADLEPTLGALEAAGYRRLPEGSEDHIPPGGSADPAEWVKRLAINRPEERPANIHIRVEGAANQRYPLLFRDYLRTHGSSALAYGALKRGLAAILDDIGTYADVKDPACDLIALAAEDWAIATGWDPGRSDG